MHNGTVNSVMWHFSLVSLYSFVLRHQRNFTAEVVVNKFYFLYIVIFGVFDTY